MRPSELLALRSEDLVPPLVPLLPCWSVVIAASESGVSTKIRISHGSVFMDQRWLHLVNKLLPAVKAGSSEEKIWFFDYPAAANMFKSASDTLGLVGMTMHQTCHNGASIDRRKRSALSQETTKEVVWRRTTTLSHACSETSWKHLRNVPRYCRDDCKSRSSQTHGWKVFAGRVRWICLPDKSDKSYGSAWLCIRHNFGEAPCSHQISTRRLRL